MRASLLVAALILCAAPGASAQDVEMLAEHYGTRPPAAYYAEMGRDGTAFRFEHGRAARLRARMAADQGRPGAARVLGPRDEPVTGNFKIPVLLGLFSDSPDSIRYGLDTVQVSYFGAGGGTITAFYDEISGGLVQLTGDVQDWSQATMTRAQATGGESGLSSGLTGTWITQLLALHTEVDWGQYDNDGPDGLPNSGDDDGYVDALAVLQPTAGAECGGIDQDNRIWSHRWSLRFAAGSAFTTATPAAGGGFILVDDYVVQPIFSCNETDLNEIGVFSHELGHAFGLPDLYDTDDSDGKHAGAGNWDLMASGSWGCNGASAASPCHMGAWSKAVLGWANVTTLPDGADLGTLTLPPVETSGTVYRVDAGDGSGEYFLLENRQRLGFDQGLFGEGLLIWQVDPDWVSARWGANRVNASSHRGVWLRQADGLDELGQSGGGRGDSGDPFPYSDAFRENRVFHAVSDPAATSFLGSPTGLTITDIQRSGDDVTFRLLTRFTTVSMRADGGKGEGGLFTVNGTTVPTPTYQFTAAPFVEFAIEAAAGEELGPGIRRPFLGWADAAEEPRSRRLVTPLADVELVASYGGRQLQLGIEVTGGVNGIEPGTFETEPTSSDLWFEEGTPVSVRAVPRTGFGFLEWTGGLAGQPNPANVTMNAPIDAGASFELIYAVAETTIDFRAATAQEIQFEVENGTAPVFWTVAGGALPEGMTMNAAGMLTGAALEDGSFPVTLQARDAIGLLATGTVTLQIDAPAFTAAQLASHFLLVGPELTNPEMYYLDRQGNADGGYDLGDFRAWVLSHPGLPLSADLRSLLEPRTVVLTGRANAGDGR
jgi:M6 family metalloprotease-like protein